jgi:hypothetical protein
MYFAAPALVIGLLLGIAVKRWWIVVVLAVVGVVLSTIGWQAAWFADEDTPAFGGALLFVLSICAPIAAGAGLGVYLVRSRARSRDVEGSSLPIVGPGSDVCDRQ